MCLPIIGAVVSGVGAVMGAMQAAAMHKANQQALERQAQIERQQGAIEGKKVERAVYRNLGQTRANYAASGLALTGSAGDVLDESAIEGALDVATVRWNADTRADMTKYRADIEGAKAKDARTSAAFSFLKPVLGAAATMDSGFMKRSR